MECGQDCELDSSVSQSSSLASVELLEQNVEDYYWRRVPSFSSNDKVFDRLQQMALLIIVPRPSQDTAHISSAFRTSLLWVWQCFSTLHFSILFVAYSEEERKILANTVLWRSSLSPCLWCKHEGPMDETTSRCG